MYRILCSTIFAAGLTFAGSVPSNSIRGEYVEARTADIYTGPCFANSEVGLTGELAVFGWRVSQGKWNGVNLDGLSVVGAVRARHTLGDVYETAYPVKAVLIVDSKAAVEQQLALRAFAKHMAGDLLGDIVKVDAQPIEIKFANGNVHSGSATLTAGTLARIETRSMSGADHICGNEETWYQPLTHLSHAMPAYSMENRFMGAGLGTVWSNPDKRSAFVGSFVVQPPE